MEVEETMKKLILVAFLLLIFTLPFNDTAVQNIVQPLVAPINEEFPFEDMKIELWDSDWGTLPSTTIKILSKTDILLDVEIKITGELNEGYSYSIRNMRIEIHQITRSGGWVTDNTVKQETYYDLQPDTNGQVIVTLNLTPQDDPPLGEIGDEYYVGVSGKINVFMEGEFNPISIESLEQVFTDHFFLEAWTPEWGALPYASINILSKTNFLLDVEVNITEEMNEGYTYSIRNMRIEIHQITRNGGWVTDKTVKQETYYDIHPDVGGQVIVTLSLTPQDDPPLGEVGAEYYVGVSGKINVFAEGEFNPISIEPLEQVFTNHFFLEASIPDWGTLPYASINILSKTDFLLNAVVIIVGDMNEGYSYSIRNVRIEIHQITRNEGWVTDTIVKQEIYYELQPDTNGQVNVTLSLTPQDNPPLGKVGAEYYVGVSGKINVFVEGEFNPISIEPLEQVFTDNFFLEAHDPFWGVILTLNITSATERLLYIEADVDYSGVDQLYRVTSPVESILLLVEKNTTCGWETVAELNISKPIEDPENHYRVFIKLPDCCRGFPRAKAGIKYKITATAIVKVTEETFTISETQETDIEPSPPKFHRYMKFLKKIITFSCNKSWRKVGERIKQVIMQKIDELVRMYEEGNVLGAYNKLLHDIKPKLTGMKVDENNNTFGNGIFKNTWVINSELQVKLNCIINGILKFLKSVIN